MLLGPDAHDFMSWLSSNSVEVSLKRLANKKNATEYTGLQRIRMLEGEDKGYLSDVTQIRSQKRVHGL